MRILIAGVSTRALAQSARAARYDFLTLDYFGDYDQKLCCKNYSLKRDFDLPYGADQLFEASRTLQYDALIYTASLENHPRIVARLAGSRRLLGNDPAALAGVRDPAGLAAFAAQHGCAVPVTVAPGQTPDPVPPGQPGRRWLVKPVSSGGGREIAFWQGEPVPRGCLLQEYLPGTPCSAAFVANGREAVLLGVTEQLAGRPELGARDFWYCGNLLPGAALAPHVAEVQALAAGLTQAYGLVGLNGLDFVRHDGRLYLLEVNPRYSASMELVEMATGLSMCEVHVRAALYGELPPGRDLAGERCYGKAILYAERDCRAPDTRGWPARAIRDVPWPGEDLGAGGPVCTILADGPTAAACYEQLVARAEALKGELYA